MAVPNQSLAQAPLTRTPRTSGGRLMTEPLISIRLPNEKQRFQPGDTLRCEYQVDYHTNEEMLAVEVSVLWFSEGKGDEDLGVHFFERRTPGEIENGDLRQLWRFETLLPNSPLSYSGIIVKLRWCVRVRVFMKKGKDVIREHPFVLGNVRSARSAKGLVNQDDFESPQKPR